MTGPFGPDGAFSTAGEYHAFAHGVYMGVTTHPLQTPPEPDREDVRLEQPYYRAGYVVGTLLQVVVIVILLRVGYAVGF